VPPTYPPIIPRLRNNRVSETEPCKPAHEEQTFIICLRITKFTAKFLFMKRIVFLFLTLTVVVSAQQQISLEDIWAKGTFAPKHARGFNVMKDGQSYADIGSSKDGVASIMQYDMRTGKLIKELVNGNDLKFNNTFLDAGSYAFSPGEDKILLYSGMEHVYRRSPMASYFVYDLATKKIISLSEQGKQMFPKFSPDGSKVAYVSANNLYILDLVTNAVTPVTRDGEHNKIKNGWADWVYEEEFSRGDYFEWSVNSRYLAYIRFDETKVKEYSMDIYKNELYPERYTFKYPKAGEDNSIVSVHIFNTLDNSSVKADIGAETDIYIPRIKFSNDPGKLCIQRMNRLQNKLEYLFADVTNGNTNVILTEESRTYLDITDDLTFVGNKGFITTSEKDGYNHIYYYDLKGRLINQVTSGNWDVTVFSGYDEARNTLYYVSTELSAINRDVYAIQLNGKNKKRLSQKEGQSDFEFTQGYKYYISSWSDANTPPVYELYSIDGKLLKVLEDNTALRTRMKNYNLVSKQFVTFKNPEGTLLNGYMVRPLNFDSTKKYPVYMYAYNGPGSNLVNNSWSTYDYFWHNLLAQEGYMVVCVDGRGTMGRGREFKHSTYLQLGKLETIDQIEVARQLGALPYVDKTRIGFMGWSYGGYMAGLMITKGSDVIKAAIAVAPVTNWKYYDNIYTERFLRRPSENQSGYEDNSPVNFVKNIKGKFLLIHGSADDNVHLQNSMELAAEMVKHNIPFDMMIYPNRNHGISGGYTRLHIYSKMLKFVKENI
jgi:dipeptidyl-peptidase 4